MVWRKSIKRPLLPVSKAIYQQLLFHHNFQYFNQLHSTRPTQSVISNSSNNQHAFLNLQHCGSCPRPFIQSPWLCRLRGFSRQRIPQCHLGWQFRYHLHVQRQCWWRYQVNHNSLSLDKESKLCKIHMFDQRYWQVCSVALDCESGYSATFDLSGDGSVKYAYPGGSGTFATGGFVSGNYGKSFCTLPKT